VVIAILVIVGGESANSMLMSNLRGNLTGARNYLDLLKAETGVRVGQLVKSDRLNQLRHSRKNAEELNRILATTAKGSGLDFLVIAAADGSIIAASTAIASNARLPDSYVIRQARIGLTHVAYELFDADDLRSFSSEFPAQALVEYAPLFPTVRRWPRLMDC